MNNTERIAADAYEREGWEVLRSGWPDFLLTRERGGVIEIAFAEVKNEDENPRPNQKKILNLLKRLAPTTVCRVTQQQKEQWTIESYDKWEKEKDAAS
jgi:VRR-NUC domain